MRCCLRPVRLASEQSGLDLGLGRNKHVDKEDAVVLHALLPDGRTITAYRRFDGRRYYLVVTDGSNPGPDWRSSIAGHVDHTVFVEGRDLLCDGPTRAAVFGLADRAWQRHLAEVHAVCRRRILATRRRAHRSSRGLH